MCIKEGERGGERERKKIGETPIAYSIDHHLMGVINVGECFGITVSPKGHLPLQPLGIEAGGHARL